jgi:pilus assembly protein Flp/PilA
MIRLLERFLGDESGATAVEYGIMVALIAVAIVASVSILGMFVRDNLFAAAESAIVEGTQR